eukprot:GFUD01008596.1.p1 GENE.GFUD01008596.1~~GFUD01008596.1.p1  ORF type:complete len:1107 (-),score=154.31 GFUD01008596.1:37-3357(-)
MLKQSSTVSLYEPTYDLNEKICRKKIIIVGDATTGKTSIIRRFTEGSMPSEYTQTFFENSKKRINVNDEKIDLNIFDTGGGHDFDNIRPFNYTGADLCIISFAIDDPGSFENVINRWRPEISEHLSDVPVILVGTKEDQRNDANKDTCVTYKQGNKVATTINATFYLECSAKKNSGIKEIFHCAEKILGVDNSRADIGHWGSRHKKSINELVADVISGKALMSKNLYDKKILEMLKENKQIPELVVDESFFKNCFFFQLNGVLDHLLKSEPEKFEQYFLSQNQEVPYAFQTNSEQVALEIMEQYPPETWKLRFRNQLNENILHHFITQGFQYAVSYLLDNHEIFDLCLDENSAGNTPLMTMVSQTETDIALKMWDYMHEVDSLRLLGRIKYTNKSNKNILHLCTEHRQCQLLRAIVSIMQSQNIFREEIISAFNCPFPNGRRVFDMLQNQEVLVELLEIIGTENLDLDYVDIKGDNVLHRLAQMNYLEAIRKLLNGTKDFIFRNLIFQKNKNGNNPLMSAAVGNSNQSLCYMMHKLVTHLAANEKEDLLHWKNNFQETLLSLVLQQQGTLPVPQTILLELEKEYHGSEQEVTRCLRASLQSSLEVHKVLANIEETYPKGMFKKIRIWMKILLFSFLVPVIFMLVDIGTDTNLAVDYHNDYFYNSTSCFNETTKMVNMECEEFKVETANFSFLNSNAQGCPLSETIASCEKVCNLACNQSLGLENEVVEPLFYSYPEALSCKAKFFYCLFFILIPWFAYLIEFYYSEKFNSYIKEITQMASQGKRGSQKIKALFKVIGILMKMVCTWIMWPWLLFWEKFLSEAKNATTHGSLKIQYEALNEKNSILCSRARMIEVCSESSFQPLLQMYLLLPQIARFWEGNFVIHSKFTVIAGSVESLQFWAVATSVLSLANSFTNYHVVRKRGALDFIVNPAGRMLLCLSGLLQIISRITVLVLYAYCWGPGNFWQMFTSVLIHILLMSVLHFVTSNVWHSEHRNFRLIYNCLINGISNLYLHNMILMEDTYKKKRQTPVSTFRRQVIFDVIFVIENGIMLGMVHFRTPQLDVQKRLLLSIFVGHVTGLIMKWIYYSLFHLWRNSRKPLHPKCVSQ